MARHHTEVGVDVSMLSSSLKLVREQMPALVLVEPTQLRGNPRVSTNQTRASREQALSLEVQHRSLV